MPPRGAARLGNKQGVWHAPILTFAPNRLPNRLCAA